MATQFYRWCVCAPLLTLMMLVPLALIGAGCNSGNDPMPRLYGAPSTAHPPSNVWSGFRGASGNGKSSELGFRVRWDSSHMHWSTPIPGAGNSSPIVWHERIFVTTTQRDSDGRRLHLVCLDRNNGSILWKRQLTQVRGRTHQKNGYASSTPVTDGQRVYVAAGSSGLFCFDFQGNQRWRVALGTISHQWGAASSPMLVGSFVIQLCDSETESSLKAFDKSSGQVAWSTPRASKGSWSTPVLFDAASSTPQVIINGTGTADGSPGSVISYDVKTGRETWRINGTSDIPCPSVIVDGRWIISSSGSNGPVIGIEYDQGPEVRWSLPSGGPYVPTGLIYGKRLFLISDSGILTCRDLSNGKLKWRRRFRDTFSASLVGAENRIYAVSERGRVYVVAAADKFELMATNQLRETAYATPALANGEVFIRTASRLHCISSLGR